MNIVSCINIIVLNPTNIEILCIQVSSNGIISFGSGFPNFGATLFPNPNNPIVFNSYIAAPYWSDIDGRTFGEVWYETHVAGQSATADSMLERVSNLVRSEQNLSSFKGTWMVVATWNGSVSFAGNDVLVCLKKPFKISFSLPESAYSSLINFVSHFNQRGHPSFL